MSGLGQGGVSTFAGATPGAPYPQYFGIFFGVVNNNADPQKNNRCLLQVPQLFGTAVTTWAISLTPLQNPPAVGTVITAMFIGGDVDYPVYLVTDPQILVESTAGNIQPVNTTASAGTSKKLAAADHVHTLANALESTGTNIQPVGTQAAGSSAKAARADHVHGVTDPLVVTDLSVTNTAQIGTVQPLTTLFTPAGYAINSVNTPSIASLPGEPNSGSLWVSGERNWMNSNWVNNINANFSNLISALQSAGVLH